MSGSDIHFYSILNMNTTSPKHCDYLRSNELAVNRTFIGQTSSYHYLFCFVFRFPSSRSHGQGEKVICFFSPYFLSQSFFLWGLEVL